MSKSLRIEIATSILPIWISSKNPWYLASGRAFKIAVTKNYRICNERETVHSFSQELRIDNKNGGGICIGKFTLGTIPEGGWGKLYIKNVCFNPISGKTLSAGKKQAVVLLNTGRKDQFFSSTQYTLHLA